MIRLDPSDPEFQRIQRDAASAFGDAEPSPVASPTPSGAPSPARAPAPDLGDLVCAEMMRRKGTPTPPPADDLAAADRLIGEIQFRRSAGQPAPRPAPSSAPPTGDIGDQVVEVLLARRGCGVGQ